MKRISLRRFAFGIACLVAAPCAAQQAQNAPTTAAAKPVAPPPLTQAERRLAKAVVLAELMAPTDLTIDSYVTNISLGMRIGFEALPENKVLAAQYPGLVDGIILATQPRARALVTVEQGPIQAASAGFLADQFTITELDQGIRLYRQPVMIKLIRSSIVGAKANATAQNVKSQLAMGGTDPELSRAAVLRDGNQSARRAFAKLTAAEIRTIAPLLQSEFSEKWQRVRPVLDKPMFNLVQESIQRVSSDEEMRTLAVVAMAEFIAKADAAKPAASATISPPAK